jgi:hypothetical protein
LESLEEGPLFKSQKSSNLFSPLTHIGDSIRAKLEFTQQEKNWILSIADRQEPGFVSVIDETREGNRFKGLPFKTGPSANVQVVDLVYKAKISNTHN